ncbi:MAG TPA: glycosyltransferase [Fibrobacteria bacterium]|jgi:cellulose synthase/poly-beta-1,6-N-acetylglucosamine synthase-like glycosyltransferase|nr:glycosyltransferase [Fibrobacteria bacterium]
MLGLLFLFACVGYALLDLRLIRGLERLQEGSSRDPLEPSSVDLPVVTVLVAARDEEANLPRTLDALLAQDWPRDKLQVVVADDRSTDGTAAVLADYVARHPGLVEAVTVTELPPGMSPKKNALARGLDAARGEWIAVTDADCVMGPGWLAALAAEFGGNTGMVLGLTAYEEPPRGFEPAEGTRALEFVSYGIVASGLIGLGFPVMGNANNLAYRRRAFDEAGGFARHGAVVSGDDDFTLQEIHATGKWSVRYCVNPKALVRTAPPENWARFWEQRKRWAGKTVHYRRKQVFFLSLIFAFYASIALLLLAGLFHLGDGSLGLLGLAGLAVKTAADFAVMKKGLELFGLSPLLRFFPFTAALHIPVMVGSFLAGTFGGFTWKGQKMRTKA